LAHLFNRIKTRDVSRVLVLFLALRQVWPKFVGGVNFNVGGEFPPKRSLDKTLIYRRWRPIVGDSFL